MPSWDAIRLYCLSKFQESVQAQLPLAECSAWYHPDNSRLEFTACIPANRQVNSLLPFSHGDFLGADFAAETAELAYTYSPEVGANYILSMDLLKPFICDWLKQNEHRILSRTAEAFSLFLWTDADRKSTNLITSDEAIELATKAWADLYVRDIALKIIRTISSHDSLPEGT